MTEIVSGGAKGTDSCARAYALSHGIPICEFYPDYRRFGRGTPLKRNLQIIERADAVLAFWDGNSRGTKFVIDRCVDCGIPLTVIRLEEKGDE
ncbi:MAG: hypothetical protein ACI4PO_11160 [Faecousia sp.]